MKKNWGGSCLDRSSVSQGGKDRFDKSIWCSSSTRKARGYVERSRKHIVPLKKYFRFWKPINTFRPLPTCIAVTAFGAGSSQSLIEAMEQTAPRPYSCGVIEHIPCKAVACHVTSLHRWILVSFTCTRSYRGGRLASPNYSAAWRRDEARQPTATAGKNFQVHGSSHANCPIHRTFNSP